jgi:ABC-type glycerol-3-phosphate transport system substrate-binding protein
MNKKIIAIIVGVAILVGIVILVLVLRKPSTPQKVDIVIWNIFDTEDQWQPLIDAYQKYRLQNKLTTQVKVTVVKKNYTSLEDYEKDFTNAIANGEGPDILQIKNDWLSNNYKKLTPLPADIMTSKQYQDRFLPAVFNEQTKYKFNEKQNIYGIPLTVDSLILIYNINQLGETGSQPPTNWEEFVKLSEDLTKRDGNQIVRAGTALGTANNIPNTTDILSLLMIQNGTQMVSDNENEVYFNRFEEKDGKDYYPGTEALKMYTDFATPRKQAYSWNETMPDAISAFVGGKTTMLIGYLDDVTKITQKNPKFQFNAALIPQAQKNNEKNYISFWMFSVSKNSKNPTIAWDFLKFITSSDNGDALQQYYQTEKKNLVVSSLTKIAQTQEGNQYIGPVAKEVNNNAQSWYQADALEMNKIFLNMIRAVNDGQPAQASIDAAAKSANKLFLSVQGNN